MSQLKKYLLNGLIIMYLGIIYFSGVPETNTLDARIKKHATDAAFVLGIWPSWSMFAPNPIKFDSKTFVEVSYLDGRKIREDVEIKLSGPLATFRKARWMKYSQDNLRSPNQRAILWPALRHFREKYYLNGNPITSIQISRDWKDVHPFNHKGLVPIDGPVARVENSEILIAESYKE